LHEEAHIGRSPYIIVAKRRLIKIVQDIPPCTFHQCLADLFAVLASIVKLIAAQTEQHGLNDCFGIPGSFES
jgi:hypothetical protein